MDRAEASPRCIGLMRRMWRAVRQAGVDYVVEELGVHIYWSRREAWEPWRWAMNYADGSGATGRLGPFGFETDKQVPGAPLDTDPPPAWAIGWDAA